MNAFNGIQILWVFQSGFLFWYYSKYVNKMVWYQYKKHGNIARAIRNSRRSSTCDISTTSYVTSTSLWTQIQIYRSIHTYAHSIYKETHFCCIRIITLTFNSITSYIIICSIHPTKLTARVTKLWRTVNYLLCR